MTQIAYRGNLSSAYFPMLSELEGHTVIIPKSDNNFNRQLQSSVDADKDIGIPQIYYCHNVIPNENGLQSVGYDLRCAATGSNGQVLPTSTINSQYFMRQDDINGKLYFMLNQTGFYFWGDSYGGYGGFINAYWNGTTILPLPTNLTGKDVSVAHVQGVSFLCIANFGTFTYNFTLGRLERVTLIGLADSAILGLTQSNGYLVAYGTDSVAWSSTINDLDFQPSLITGAGGGTLEGAKGDIVCAVQSVSGILFFTTENVVSAMYTNNTRYPFSFVEVQNAGGLSSAEQCTNEAYSGVTYAYTTKGLQSVADKNTQTIFPAVTDFISGQVFEDFNESTNELSTYTLLAGTQLLRKLTIVAARYFVLSYGVNALTHALVYDMTMKRWGKLKYEHVDAFELHELTSPVDNQPRRSLAFLQADGTVVTVNSTVNNNNRAGVLFLGKYQYVRERNISLHYVDIENVNPGAPFTVQDWVSWYGKGYNQKIPGTIFPQQSFGKSVRYGFGDPDAISHTFVLQGAFTCVTIAMKLTPTGRM